VQVEVWRFFAHVHCSADQWLELTILIIVLPVLDDDLSYSEVEAMSYSTLIGPSLHITGIDVNTDATKVLVGGRQSKSSHSSVRLFWH